MTEQIGEKVERERGLREWIMGYIWRRYWISWRLR